MQCQECHERPASLHFSQTINGEKREIHVCEKCAKDKGYVTPPSEDIYTLHHLLAGLFNFEPETMKPSASHESLSLKKSLECPNCSMSFSQFKKIGKFGCATCYQTFSSHLDPIFRRVHSGNTKHNGKIPKRKGSHLHVQKQIESYKVELQQLIEKEEFEQAAVVRDKIRGLQADEEAGDDS